MDKLKSENKLPPLVETEEGIADRIFTIRGVQVMLGSDIASLFQVGVKPMNQQMKRNPDRFPEDFCFQLAKEEILRSQFATSSLWGGRRYLPYVYAEQGIIALSKSILPILFPRYSGSTPSPLVLVYPLGGWPIARQTTVVTSPTTLPPSSATKVA